MDEHMYRPAMMVKRGSVPISDLLNLTADFMNQEFANAPLAFCLLSKCNPLSSLARHQPESGSLHWTDIQIEAFHTIQLKHSWLVPAFPLILAGAVRFELTEPLLTR